MISENENLLEMRKKIILTVSHDIRGPLGNIHNCADLATETRQKKKREMFLAKAANAFLPKLVYQLEEYGLPRTLSRKIQNSGLIDLENDEMEVSDIIEEFKKIGYDKLTESIQDIHQFEKFILKYFYSGIS